MFLLKRYFWFGASTIVFLIWLLIVGYSFWSFGAWIISDTPWWHWLAASGVAFLLRGPAWLLAEHAKQHV